jgi:hypothetical protein
MAMRSGNPKIAPGVKINLNKGSISATVGGGRKDKP